MEQVEFNSYTWSVNEDDNRTVIDIYGLKKNGDDKYQNVCIHVNDFTPYVYLELPPAMNWNKSKANLVGEKLRKILGNRTTLITYELKMKKKLYFANYTKDKKPILFPYLLCVFKSYKEIKFLQYNLKNSLFVSGIGKINIKFHEQDANPILQLCCCRNLPTAGWITGFGKIVDKEDMTTSCDVEYNIKNKSLMPINKNILAKPLIMGFDIEVYSSIKSAMPNPENPQDKVFQISCILSIEGSNKFEKYLLSLGQPCPEIVGKDVNIYGYDTEAELLLGFSDLIRKTNPNILVGYNILGFDIPYMIDRAKLNLVISEFDRQGFPYYKHAKEKTIKWSSSAYGVQEFQFLDAEGRVFVDLLPIIKRDYKLNNYKLKTVSEHFLDDDTKDPLTAQDIFRCYEIGTKRNNKGEYDNNAIKAISEVGKYCVQDTALCNKLMTKLDIWTGLCEMGTICNVPLFSLYTQGQQFKVYSQVYKFCMAKNIIVEKDGYITKENERYVGAHVFDPVPGVYDKVVPFDFASLYPTTMIAYNIDYSSLVDDSVKNDIKDEDCHVMDFEDHLGCEHDPKVIRRKQLSNIIDNYKARIKELRTERDKTKGKINKLPFNKQIEELTKDYKPFQEERSELVKSISKNVMCEKRYYRFLKEPKGVIPTVLQNLLDARKNTRKQMKKNKEIIKKLGEDKSKSSKKQIEELTLLNKVLDKRQLSYKVSCNSMYGAMGVKRGYLPFMPGAMCTTYMGRVNIEKVADVIPREFGGKLIYGDSVSGDTPILIKYSNETIDLLTIDSISNNWTDYEEFKSEDSNRYEKQKCLVDAEVWTNNKWSKLKKVIRHKTKKKMYRILTHTGCVDVTEDHSLLTKYGEKIKPGEVKIGDELLHSFPTHFDEFETETVEGVSNSFKCNKCKKTKPEFEFYKKDDNIYKTCKECCYYNNHRNKENVKNYFSEYKYNKGNFLTKEEAFVWGFFMADGSGGKYDCGKYSWAINNSNIDYLKKTKKYLEFVEPHFEFKILDTMKSSGVYKLVAKGKVRLISQKYHQIFYNKDKYKIVPYPILNASKEIKYYFLEGYYTGDGHKCENDKIIPTNNALRMDCKGKIGSQGLYLLLKSLGYKNVSINTRENKPNIFRINATNNKPKKNPIKIKKIIELPIVDVDEFVYDIETEEGVFHAGIGELIVKNTDSNYIQFPHLKNPEEIWEYAEHVAAEVTKLFPKPINNNRWATAGCL